MVWVHGSFNFYMITFYLKYFPGNVYVNAMSFAAADLTAYTCSGLILKFLTIRVGLTLAYSIALLSGFTYFFFYKSSIEWIIPLIVALCRVGTSMSYNIGYVSVAKLFPTEFVTSVFGIVNLVSHLVTTMAPIVSEVKQPIPMLVYCANCGLALIFSAGLLEYDTIKSI
jgi:hypothetical protein